MKKFLFTVVAVCALLGFAFPQSQLANGNGVYNASQYNKWFVIVYAGNSATGSQTITLSQGSVTLPGGGRQFVPFSTNNTLQVNDGANTETITPTAVSGCAINALENTCQITAVFANTHGKGVTVSSGTFGLSEAFTDAAANGGGVVDIDPSFAGTDSTIANLPNRSTSVQLRDLRNGFARFWALRPSAVTQIAAPSAPTVNVTTGSLSSGAYRAMAAYVDCNGGISLASTDSAQTASTTGLSIASPAATTGACGWIPYITAAGGGTGTEIMAEQTLGGVGCKLSTLETITPACAIGSAWTSGALSNPSSTSKPVVESFAFTTPTYQPFNLSPPPPFVNVYPFGVFVVGGTLNSGGTANLDLAQWITPAGYLNQLGKGFRVCFKAATATQVASSTLTAALTVSANYAQSPVTVGSIAFATQTQAAAGTQRGCFDVVTSTVGSSGKFWVDTPMLPTNTLNSTPSQTVSAAVDVTTAQSSAVDLTKQLYWSINFADGTANNITGPIVNDVRITPLQ